MVAPFRNFGESAGPSPGCLDARANGTWTRRVPGRSVPCATNCTRISICAAYKMPVSGHFSIEEKGVMAKGGIEPPTHGFSVVSYAVNRCTNGPPSLVEAPQESPSVLRFPYVLSSAWPATKAPIERPELDLTRAPLFHWLQRKSVFTVIVNAAAFTVLGVLTQSMFNMISGAVVYALPANLHRTMTMHAPNGLVRCTHKRDRNLNPEPFLLARKRKLLFLLAISHQLMCHRIHFNSPRSSLASSQ